MERVIVNVDSGVCGFTSKIEAKKSGKRSAGIVITGTDCALIQKYSEILNDISLTDLFIPLTKNPIFMAAEKANCHLPCPVPTAVAKAVEVVLDLALPKDANIVFIK